jgi:hypothetical protein
MFQGLSDALRKYSPLKQQMEEQSGHLLRNSSEQNSRLALQAADLLSRWTNLERRTREQHSRSLSKTQDEPQKAEESTSKERVPPVLSQESVQNTDDFGTSVTNWLEALRNAASTLDFIEYPSPDVQNWLQRIEVIYSFKQYTFIL